MALKLKVLGMTCGHCASAVTKAVKAVPAVQDVSVDLQAGEVSVKGEPDREAVRRAIVEEGYEVQAIA